MENQRSRPHNPHPKYSLYVSWIPSLLSMISQPVSPHINLWNIPFPRHPQACPGTANTAQSMARLTRIASSLEIPRRDVRASMRVLLLRNTILTFYIRMTWLVTLDSGYHYLFAHNVGLPSTNLRHTDFESFTSLMDSSS